MPERHWQIDFSTGLPVFTEMTRGAAVALMSERRGRVRQVTDWYGVDVDWGDVWDDVTDAVTELVDVVVSAVVDPITKAVSEIQVQILLMIDGTHAEFDATVEFVEQAFDMVAGFFTKIAVELKGLWQWLSYLFAWGDIVRTAEVTAHILNVGLGFSASAATHAKFVLEERLAELSQFVKTGMDDFINSFAGQQTIGEWIRPVTPPDPVYEARIGDNPLLDALLANYAQAATLLPARVPVKVGDNPALDKLVQLVTQLNDEFTNGGGVAAFQEALQYFESIKDNPDQILVLALRGLLKIAEGIALVALQGFALVLGAFFDAVNAAIAAVQSLLNEKWTVPVASDIYKWATGSQDGSFSIVELFALIAAIPATSIYKATFGAAPFPDENAVAAVKSLVTVGWLEQRAWGGGPAMAAADPDILTITRRVCNVVYAGNFAVRAFVEYPINISPTPVPLLPFQNIGQRYFSSALSIP